MTKLSYSKSYTETLKYATIKWRFHTTIHRAYLTVKFNNLLSQLKHFCVNVSKCFMSSSKANNDNTIRQ